MNATPVRIFTRSDVERLLDVHACSTAVESAFAARGAGTPTPSGVLGVHGDGGGFHVKAAILEVPAIDGGPRRLFAAKVNANFPDNRTRHALPTIQGVLALFDATTGEPLALMDAIALTALRTAAATAVAARHLAAPDADTLAVVGCGVQALAHVEALAAVRPIARVLAHDTHADAADALARAATARCRVPVDTVARLEDATCAAAIVVTCTPTRSAFLAPEHVRPGAFVAAVGADNEAKSEITPALMARAAVVVDDLAQCRRMGDLHHALEAGAMRVDDVRAELSAVVVDPACGRRHADEIVLFDSTGVAIQDVAAAAVVYERGLREHVGATIELGA